MKIIESGLLGLVKFYISLKTITNKRGVVKGVRLEEIETKNRIYLML